MFTRDIFLYSGYLNAQHASNPPVASFYARKFSPELQEAYEAWMRAEPSGNPDAPPDPFATNLYQLPLLARADAAEPESERLSLESGVAAWTAHQYTLISVLLAAALFFGGTAPRFEMPIKRCAVLVLGLAALLTATWMFLTLLRSEGAMIRASQSSTADRSIIRSGPDVKTRTAGLALLAAQSSPASELANDSADLPLGTTNLTLYSVLLAAGLSGSMFALMEIGRRIGLQHLQTSADLARKGLAAVDGTVFSLLGLLVAFSFHGAAARFDARRELIIQEAGRIRTAWLQVDLLPEDDRSALQALFRQYLDSRLHTYRRPPNAPAVSAELARTLDLQDAIWTRALAAGQERSPSYVNTLLMPALTQMFVFADTRIATARIHPPKAIFATLISLTLISALLIGHGMAGRTSRSWTHILGFVITMASAIYLIYELEYPRLGLIRIDAMDQVLVDLRQRMD